MMYYTQAITSRGMCDFTKENVFDIGNVVSLKTSNKNLADAVVSEFCSGLINCREYIISPGSKILKSGVVDYNRDFAVVSNYAQAQKSIDIDKHFDFFHPEIFEVPREMAVAYKEAKHIHDNWEKIYIENMDFDRLNSFCKDKIDTLVKEDSKYGTGKTYKRFFGTTTIGGNVNFIDGITSALPYRYFIKGRPGTGKSTFLKKLSASLTKNNYDIEQYYCSFDPDSLDMVVSRELGFCVFDSTAPHEKFPERKGDTILDFYKESGLTGVDEKYMKELITIKEAYDAKIAEGKKAYREYMLLKNEENIRELSKINKDGILSAVKILRDIL